MYRPESPPGQPDLHRSAFVPLNCGASWLTIVTHICLGCSATTSTSDTHPITTHLSKGSATSSPASSTSLFEATTTPSASETRNTSIAVVAGSLSGGIVLLAIGLTLLLLKRRQRLQRRLKQETLQHGRLGNSSSECFPRPIALPPCSRNSCHLLSQQGWGQDQDLGEGQIWRYGHPRRFANKTHDTVHLSFKTLPTMALVCHSRGPRHQPLPSPLPRRSLPPPLPPAGQVATSR